VTSAAVKESSHSPQREDAWGLIGQKTAASLLWRSKDFTPPRVSDTPPTSWTQINVSRRLKTPLEKLLCCPNPPASYTKTRDLSLDGSHQRLHTQVSKQRESTARIRTIQTAIMPGPAKRWGKCNHHPSLLPCAPTRENAASLSRQRCASVNSSLGTGAMRRSIAKEMRSGFNYVPSGVMAS
jgi:hypothetical protein